MYSAHVRLVSPIIIINIHFHSPFILVSSLLSLCFVSYSLLTVINPLCVHTQSLGVQHTTSCLSRMYICELSLYFSPFGVCGCSFSVYRNISDKHKHMHAHRPYTQTTDSYWRLTVKPTPIQTQSHSYCV